MRLVDPHVELIDEQDQLKKIELAGRTCYKSESAITEDSAGKFVAALAKRKHYAMLEHGTFCFMLRLRDKRKTSELGEYVVYLQGNKYMNISYVEKLEAWVVSCNARAVIERKILDPVASAVFNMYPQLVQNPDILSVPTRWPNIVATPVTLTSKNASEADIRKHTFVTMRITCDRGVTHELVRHRPFSFAQESTRYCNYSKDQFKNELTFIRPSTFKDWSDKQQKLFCDTCRAAETAYMEMVSSADTLTPQQARAVLNNALKAEIVVTGNMEEWDHFFALRYFGVTGAPHPDMEAVATLAYLIYEGIEKDLNINS